ncbi:MAG: LytTR family DNA-binding domain-containing protein [Eubacteriales bacterium]|nr:LytTR family DNA-binding domain-containing protein [Eubacteriales bacterium]
MIKVAIVDDEKKELDTLSAFFKKLQTEVCEEISVCTFFSGEALLESYDYSCDLICLDIDMGGKTGMDIAREIRRQDEQVVILFITNMAQMAIQGYEVRALDFIVKPVSYYSFSMKLRGAVNLIKKRKSRNILLPVAGGIQKISTDQLYYAEVNGHYLYYHTACGVFKQKASLKELEDKLEGLSFKRCNNCYLVNLKYVDGVNRDDIQIAGEWLKISRPRKREFLQALANYMGGIDI